jgi:hypothetical protein
MPGELFEIEGEKKKRVVRADFFLFFICPEFAISPTFPTPHSAISSTLMLGDFIMVPDTRMSQFWVTMTVS